MISVTQAIKPFTDFSMISPGVLNAAAARGTKVHEHCAKYSMGQGVLVDIAHLGYFESFQQWFDRFVEDVWLVEVELVHSVWKFVGHPDIVCRIKGNTFWSVVDYKTPATKNRAWRSQIAAYIELVKDNYPSANVTSGGSLRLNRFGKTAIFDEYKTTDNDWAGFLSAFQASKYFL